MGVAAIESLIEVLRVHPSTTAHELVEIVKKEKAKLLSSTPNPLPILAGADLFEQYLLRSLRGLTDEEPKRRTTRKRRNGDGDGQGSGAATKKNNKKKDVKVEYPVVNFEKTCQHLVANKDVFARRAKEARDKIAVWGTRYVSDGGVVLAMGGSRTVTKILLRAATNPSKYFKVIYVVDGKNKRSDAAVAQLRAVGLEVETISPHKIAYVLGNTKSLNLVLVGTEVVMQNGGIISGMGTAQLAHLCKTVKGSYRRFFVAAETHKICRRTPITYPLVNRVGVSQRDISKFDNIGVPPEPGTLVLSEDEEVDYTDPELIDGFITEQGVKAPEQIWEMVDDYI